MNTDEQATQDNTTVSQVDVNLDDLFGMPGADNVMLPEEEEEKKSLFSKDAKPDYDYILYYTCQKYLTVDRKLQMQT